MSEIEALLAPIRERAKKIGNLRWFESSVFEPGKSRKALFEQSEVDTARLLAAVEAAMEFAQKCEDYKGPGPQSPGPLYGAGCMDMARWTAKDLREAIASALRGETT